MEVTLVMFKPDGERKDFPLTKSATVIGRKEDCDLRVPLAAVSRRHCQIRVKPDAVEVEDLGSTNGTFVNSKRVQQSRLKPGDLVRVGPVTFTVQVDGKPERIEATTWPAEPGAEQKELAVGAQGAGGEAADDSSDTPTELQGGDSAAALEALNDEDDAVIGDLDLELETDEEKG